MPHLPSEIWRAIFHLAAFDVQDRLHPSKPPILLTRVCRDWRDEALSTPTLWTTLNLPRFAFTEDVMISFRAHFTSMLRASSPLPLTFAINASNECTDENYFLALKCIELLCGESHRWKIAFMNSHLLSLLPDHLPVGSLPLLEHIGILGASPVNIGYTHHSNALLESAPRLTSIECHDYRSQTERFLHPAFLSLPHIRHYSAGGHVHLSMDKLFPYILKCSNLVSLDLWCPGVWDIESSHDWRMSNPGSVLLPHLRSLSAKFDNDNVLVYALAPLLLPNIISLTLAAMCLNDSDPSSCLLDFILRCRTTLRNLSLPLRWLSGVECREHLNEIQSLTISDIAWDSPILEWLQDRVLHLSNQDRLGWVAGKYNNLRSITLRHVHGRGLRSKERIFLASHFARRSNVLRDMVISRLDRQLPSPIKTFGIDYISLLAMQDCAPNCSTFLNECWSGGLGGRPSPTSAWVRRELPETWSRLRTAPRFFKEEGCEGEGGYEEETDEEEW